MAPTNLPDEKKMQPDLKSRWVAALRSGTYAQGIGQLEREGCFCCFGVLNAIRGIENGSQTTLGSGVYRLGISEEARVVLENMNDGHGDAKQCAFAEIADWIEENL